MKFALTGAAGYIAPKHMEAIKEVGELVACYDPHDSVGILDSYFPECRYFCDYERFERFLETEKIDYLSICSPNWVHDSQIRMGLSKGMKIICEKPLVLNPRNLIKSKDVNCMLQFRYGELRDLKVRDNNLVSVYYSAPRGRWYDYSWKADPEKSGGLATNIGVHLFDVLIWKFGAVQDFYIVNSDPRNLHIRMNLEKADVSVELTLDHEPSRTMIVNENVMELNNKGLHKKAYKEIVKGNGIKAEDCLPVLNFLQKIKKSS